MEDGYYEWKERKKLIRRVDFERRSSVNIDSSGTGGRMEKAVSDRWGRMQQAAKSTTWQSPSGLPKYEALGCSTGKGQEAHPKRQLGRMWSKSKRDFACSILDRLGSKTAIQNLMRMTPNAREEKTTKTESGDQRKGLFQVLFTWQHTKWFLFTWNVCLRCTDIVQYHSLPSRSTFRLHHTHF